MTLKARWAAASALLVLGGFSASAGAEQYRTEIGYPAGSLGLAAIQEGDLARAEAQLKNAKGVEASDPARLINLGQVYARTGRYHEAVKAYKAAMKREDPFDVILTDGREMSTHEAARLALIELRGAHASR